MNALLATLQASPSEATSIKVSPGVHIAPKPGELPKLQAKLLRSDSYAAGGITRSIQRIKQIGANARSNDLSANAAAIRVRLHGLRKRMEGQQYKKRQFKRPAKPDLAPQRANVPHKTVLWFGNAGHSHGDYGIPTILRFATALHRVHQETPIELCVVSNNRAKFSEYLRSLAVPTRYVEWDPAGIFEHLRKADVVILPNSNDEFSRTKSANRVLLSLACGTPVVAEDFAGLELLRPAVACEDKLIGLRRYLVDKRGAEDIALAQTIMSEHFSMPAVGAQMSDALNEVRAADQRHQANILFVFDLIQDLEVLKPVIRHFASRKEWRIRVLASNFVCAHSPSLLQFLSAQGIEPERMERDEILADQGSLLLSASLVFLASETNLGPHRVAHHIARMARRADIPALTFQHGLENEGLTYFGENKSVHFASQKILVWNDLDKMQDQVTKDTFHKCLPIGLFKEMRPGPAARSVRERIGHPQVVGVFENLHWERYSDEYRAAFVDCLISTARARRDYCFLVKPHPAGRWFTLTNERHEHMPKNILTIDNSDDYWSQVSGTELAGLVDAVVTTPSSVAVDAALAHVPVSVFAQNMQDLDMYSGLEMLHDPSDWLGFIDSCFEDQNSIVQAGNDFVKLRVQKLNPLTELEQEVSKLIERA